MADTALRVVGRTELVETVETITRREGTAMAQPTHLTLYQQSERSAEAAEAGPVLLLSLIDPVLKVETDRFYGQRLRAVRLPVREVAEEEREV
jgi:hypothetical protein